MSAENKEKLATLEYRDTVEQQLREVTKTSVDNDDAIQSMDFSCRIVFRTSKSMAYDVNPFRPDIEISKMSYV